MLDQKRKAGGVFGQGKKYDGDDAKVFGLVLALEVHYCSTRSFRRKKTFKHDVYKTMGTGISVDINDGKPMTGTFEASWRKTVECGVHIPSKENFKE